MTIVEHVHALLHASGLPKNLWAEAACHVVQLLNRTMTRAVEGMTPYEADFGKKPDLGSVHEWGEKVFMRIEGGTKLGGRVREGRWLGVDEQSKGVRIYWPDTKLITIERNVYFDDSSVSRNEGEHEEVVITKNDLLDTTNIVEAPTAQPEPQDDQSKAEIHAARIRKPTQRVQDLLQGNC